MPSAGLGDLCLGTQVEMDTPEIREALVARLSDPDEETRARPSSAWPVVRDRRVLPALRQELAADSPRPWRSKRPP